MYVYAYTFLYLYMCVYIYTYYNMGDLGLIPGLERSLGEGNGYPLQYSYLKHSMDRGAWLATIHGVTKSQM